jgi:hypothetical protein
MAAWCTQRDAGVCRRYMPQGRAVNMYMYLLYLLCDEAFLICCICVWHCVYRSLSQPVGSILLFPRHTVSCCLCTISLAFCTSQIEDITAVGFEYHDFFHL